MSETQTFEGYVDAWNDLQGEIEKRKAALKPLTDKELTMRKHIAEAVKTASGDTWKEGVNTFLLPDMRALKVTIPLKREIDIPSIPAAREAFRKLNDLPITFDELLRTKYELEKKAFDKLGPAAKVAISDMIVVKPQAPTVELS